MAESHLAYFKINLIEHTIRFLSRFLKSKEIYLHVNFESQKSVVSCSSILCRPTDKFDLSSKVVILGLCTLRDLHAWPCKAAYGLLLATNIYVCFGPYNLSYFLLKLFRVLEDLSLHCQEFHSKVWEF